MFFERYMQNVIETYVPDSTPDSTVDEALALCSKYVKKVKVQMHDVLLFQV